jgi:hypothetical protein
MFLIEDFPFPQGPYSATTRLSFPVHPLTTEARDSAKADLPRRSSDLDRIGRSAENGCVGRFKGTDHSV